MENKICENCETSYSNKLEFCPKCGMFNDSYEEIEQRGDNFNPPSLVPIEDVVREMAQNVSVIKAILVFFTVLWVISVLLSIVLMCS